MYKVVYKKKKYLICLSVKLENCHNGILNLRVYWYLSVITIYGDLKIPLILFSPHICWDWSSYVGSSYSHTSQLLKNQVIMEYKLFLLVCQGSIRRFCVQLKSIPIIFFFCGHNFFFSLKLLYSWNKGKKNNLKIYFTKFRELIETICTTSILFVKWRQRYYLVGVASAAIWNDYFQVLWLFK